jgi:hypothetical protein
MTTGYVSPVGYVDLDNDCAYSLDIKSTRSRESVDPKTDLAFYFKTYIEPKYGLGNINVSNVASFMKDLEMNWTKIDPELKPKVLDIMVDSILAKDSSFKVDLLNKLGVQPQSQIAPEIKSTFGQMSSSIHKDVKEIDPFHLGLAVVLLGLIFLLISKKFSTPAGISSRFI